MTPNMNQNATPPYTNEKDRVRIFDTTLRDGEQSPGAAMTHEEKLEVAALLDEMGVDIIEAGFPIASNGDFEAVSAISAAVKNAVVCGLSRAGFKDIDRAGEALQAGGASAHPHVHLDQPGPHEAQASDGTSRGAGSDHGLRHAGAQLDGQRRVERGGRDTHRDRLPVPRDRSSRSRPAPRRSTFPTPSDTRCRRSISSSSSCSASAFRAPTRWCFRPIVTTIWVSRLQTRSRA